MSAPWNLYSPRQRWMYLGVLFLVSISAYLDRNIVAIILEPIKTEFRVSDAMLGLLTGSAFAIFYATLGLPIARWADRGHRPTIVALSVAVWSIMTALCALTQSFWQLAAARIGVGAGEAGATPPAQSLIADYFPPVERARALGIWLISSIAALVLTMTLGVKILQHVGLRGLLAVVGVPGLALALLAKRSYRNIVIGLVFYFLMAYGALVFLISFMVRVHGFSVARAGFAVGVVTGVGALLGSLVGGVLTDRLAAREVGWLSRLPGWGLIVVCPIWIAVFAVSELTWMLTLLFAGCVVLMAVAPAIFAALRAVCGSTRRATAVAIALFFANLLGSSLGPLPAGALSDRFARSLGSAEGLRMSLILMMTLFEPCGLFLLCVRPSRCHSTWRRDVKARLQPRVTI